ncbi:MAG: glycosyltransferase [Gaiellales bacterium]
MTSPRVTVALATYNREAYLAEAIRSVLDQDFADFELLVCDNASTDGTRELVASFGDPRIRYLRNPENLGMVASWNRLVEEARGELIANLCDDDLCLPGRLARQAEVFDAHPDTDIVHGDAQVIDERGRPAGAWPSREFAPGELLHMLVRSHNHLIYPSTVIHRRVFDRLGRYTEGYAIAADFDLWLRAAAAGMHFRHTAGGPVVGFRRHPGAGSHESRRDIEVDEVQRVLESALEREGWQALAPEAVDERDARLVLAEALATRGLPLPGLAARLRDQADDGRPRIMLTSYGYDDSGGGTIVPRLLSQELARRGWDVTVFHAAVKRLDGQPAYAVREWRDNGVRLIGVFNRPHGLLDLGHPEREVDDPPITRAFAEALDRVRPDVVHFHNLHNLGAALIDEASVRGIPAYFSTHNYWLLCARNYLYTETLDLCAGPGDGTACASCVGSRDPEAYRRRMSEIRGRSTRGLDRILAVSEAMRRTLTASGYPAEMIDVVHQAMPHDGVIWEALGRDRAPGRVGDELTVGFFGTVLPHKGPSLLVDAAQITQRRVRVKVFGEIPPAFAEALRSRDARGVVELRGGFSHDQLPDLLAEVDVAVIPSLWWDCAPLMTTECLAGRVPVLAARMGGIPDFVRDGEDGLLFDGRDAGDLAEKLDRLASEPGLVEQLQAGIQEPPAFAAYVDELEGYYRGLRPGRSTAGRAPLTVSWQGDHTSLQSLAGVNRHACEGLEADPGIAVARIERERHAETLPLPAQVEVRHQYPPDLRPARSGRLAVIQPWEFGAVPRDWVEPITRNVDELWVPSEYVRRMYLDAGIPADRVTVIPNGVAVDRFTPDGPRLDLETGTGTVFLFVGGLISRKGPDLAVAAYQQAFAGRGDVTLVIKDFGADSIYSAVDRSRLREWAACGQLPRIVYLDRDLSDDEMAALYRRCDVLLHPYRGEGFGMPVLEAMACGLPVIVTAGGPTDEFVPDEACWRVRSTVRHETEQRYEHIETHGFPYLLEPDGGHLCELLAEADRDADARRARGRAGAEAARALSWRAVAARYRERIVELAQRQPLSARLDESPLELEEAALRVLATPAWRGHDRLGELLEAWVQAARPETGACLFLLADPRTAGSEDECTERVLAAATARGVTLDGCADITILRHPLTGGDELRLHAAVDAYVPLGRSSDPHSRLALTAGRPVLDPTAGAIGGWLESAAWRAA